jgi:hypothetical protein
MKVYTSELKFLRDEVEKCHKIIENQIQMLKDAMAARHAKPEQAPFSIPFITQEELQELMKEDDKDNCRYYDASIENQLRQSGIWFDRGRQSVFREVAEKVKSMPWENDTKDSFLIWLKEQV